MNKLILALSALSLASSVAQAEFFEEVYPAPLNPDINFRCQLDNGEMVTLYNKTTVITDEVGPVEQKEVQKKLQKRRVYSSFFVIGDPQLFFVSDMSHSTNLSNDDESFSFMTADEMGAPHAITIELHKRMGTASVIMGDRVHSCRRDLEVDLGVTSYDRF